MGAGASLTMTSIACDLQPERSADVLLRLRSIWESLASKPTTGWVLFAASFTGNNNRSDGYSCDIAANLLFDGLNHYTHDAENRIQSVQPMGGAATR
jgi:hypothetical protein